MKPIMTLHYDGQSYSWQFHGDTCPDSVLIMALEDLKLKIFRMVYQAQQNKQVAVANGQDEALLKMLKNRQGS